MSILFSHALILVVHPIIGADGAGGGAESCAVILVKIGAAVIGLGQLVIIVKGAGLTVGCLFLFDGRGLKAFALVFVLVRRIV